MLAFVDRSTMRSSIAYHVVKFCKSRRFRRQGDAGFEFEAGIDFGPCFGKRHFHYAYENSPHHTLSHSPEISAPCRHLYSITASRPGDRHSSHPAPRKSGRPACGSLCFGVAHTHQITSLSFASVAAGELHPSFHGIGCGLILF